MRREAEAMKANDRGTGRGGKGSGMSIQGRVMPEGRA